MAMYDAFSGLLSNKRKKPDHDPTGREGFGEYGAAPSLGGGVSPTGANSYSGLLNIPGTQPDFLGVLNSDPWLSQFKSGQLAESIADRGSLTAARQRALIQFGLVPENLSGPLAGSDLYSDVTDETRALASQNTAEGLSSIGRINRERDRAQQNIMDALAARGALRSGATGVALTDLNQDYKGAVSEAESQLMDYLSGVQQAYVQAERFRAQQLAGAQTETTDRLTEGGAFAGTEPEEADHVGFDANGQPVYRGRKSGKTFGADKTPYSGEVFATPPTTQDDSPGGTSAGYNTLVTEFPRSSPLQNPILGGTTLRR